MSQTEIGPSTIAGLARDAAERFGADVAARCKVAGAWSDQTFAEAGERVQQLALGLVGVGVSLGDRVAILCNTRVEWSLVSLAVSAAGAIVVPIYPTNAPSECEWVLGDSGASVAIVEDAGQLAKIEQVRDQLPALGHVFALDGSADGSLDALAAAGADQDPAELERRQAQVRSEDVYTI